jgi:hypothetical protein
VRDLVISKQRATIKFNDFGEHYLLGCNTVYSGRNQPTFQRNVLHPSTGSKNSPIEKPVRSRKVLHHSNPLQQGYVPATDKTTASKIKFLQNLQLQELCSLLKLIKA